MTVREYIGARYVPLYIGEWDNTKAYEPLSIVSYQGNSYTSRQAVPVGIDIANETYWVLSAAYNAQVEQYRQEVIALDDRVDSLEDSVDAIEDNVDTIENILPTTAFDSVNTVEKYIDEASKTTADIRRYGAKERSTDFDWDEVIAACAENSDIIYFPAGEWYVNKPIDLRDKNFITVVGDMAKLTVVSEIDTVMYFNTQTASGTPKAIASVNGIFFNCAGLANTALKITAGNVCVRNCRFMDYITYGIDSSTALGKQITDCQFGDDLAQYQTTQIAIAITTDSQVENCKFFGQKICVQCSNNNIISGNLFYAGDDNTQRCIAIAGTIVLEGMVITNNQFDTMPICIQNISAGIVNNNLFMWNSTVNVEGDYTIFNQTLAQGSQSTQGLIFSHNNINTFAPANKIIHTFMVEGAATVPIYLYTSEENNIKGAMEKILNLRISFGILGFAQQPETPTYCLLFERIANLPSNAVYGEKFTYECLQVENEIIIRCQNGANGAMATPRQINLSTSEYLAAKAKLTENLLGVKLSYTQMRKIETTSRLLHEGRLLTLADFESATVNYTDTVGRSKMVAI